MSVEIRMTVTKTPAAEKALRWAESALAGHVETPSVDAELLLRDVLGVTRATLFAHPERELLSPSLDRFRELVGRRARGEPLQYLTGVQSFRRLDLVVGPGVFVPRHETEMVVEHALARIDGIDDPVLVDLGTGSGAIALSIASERPQSTVFATEVSDRALAWARRNLRRIGAANVQMMHGDLFDPLPASVMGAIDLIVSNPPYLSDDDLAAAPADVRREPRVATTSGASGLEVISRIIDEAMTWLRPGGWLVIEIAHNRAAEVEEMLSAHYTDVALHQDLVGRTRIAEGRRR